MAYFTKDYTEFLKDLAGNNNREWYHANKKRFETSVKQPFEEFITAVIERLKKHDKSLDGLEAKKCIFRIYRDVRFSKDKTPYKTQMSAVVAAGGRKDMDSVGVYLELTPEWVRVYAGMYMPDTEQKDRIRHYIADNAKEFDKLVSDKTFVKFFGKVHGEQNKTVPKELKEAAEKQPLILNKQWYYFSEMKPKEITNPKLVDLVEERYLASKPLSEFLAKAIA